ncbi:MAG: hypothetical protein IKJ52_10785 [Muribaculaceae bacterium]|nr:hypothetical protein [Muribaculaceae bacterium]
MKCNYKILIIGGYDFSGTDATSITLRNIFSYMPKENIAFIKTGNYHELTDYKYINIYPSFASNISSNNSVKKLSSHNGQVAGLVGTNKTKGLKQQVFNYVHTIGSSYRMLIPYKITNSIDNFIQEFKPDYIYSLLASDAIMGLCLSISNKYNIPIIPHFMDDWQGVMFTNSAILYPARKRLISNLKKVLKKSPFALTISEKMAREYTAKYKCNCISLMNCINARAEIERKEIGREIKIIFSGGLHLNRADSIEMFCKALSNIKDFNFTLELFTSNDNWNKYSHQFADYGFVRYGGFVSQEEILKKNEEADILLHVESFNELMKKYTRLSISTKIPEYLSSQRLIIAIGPSDIASIEYLRENDAALILGNNIQDNTMALYNLLNNKGGIDNIINNAYSTYKTNHVQAELHKNLDTFLNKHK